MNHSQDNEVNVGIDTGKTQLDIYIRLSANALLSATMRKVFAKLLGISKHIGQRASLEHTFVFAAAKHKLPVVVANPLHVRRFAGAIGLLAKTDKIDARLIAHFGESIKPIQTAVVPENDRKVSDLLVRRR